MGLKEAMETARERSIEKEAHHEATMKNMPAGKTPMGVYMKQKGLTSPDIAEAIGVPAPTVRAWKSGYQRVPYRFQSAISKILGVSTPILFPQTDHRQGKGSYAKHWDVQEVASVELTDTRALKIQIQTHKEEEGRCTIALALWQVFSNGWAGFRANIGVPPDSIGEIITGLLKAVDLAGYDGGEILRATQAEYEKEAP